MKKIVRNIFLLLNLISVLAILLSYLSIYVSPSQWWVLAVFGLSYPYILLINLIFILIWLFFKTRYALLSILSIFIGFSYINDYIQFKGKSSEEAGIHIISYNVKNFFGEDPLSTKEENALGIIGYLKAENAQIICLQEVNHLSYNKVFNRKHELKIDPAKYFTHYSHSGGPATYSVFPIVNKGKIIFPTTMNMIIFSDLKIGADTIRIFNCHLQSYRINPHEINSLDSLSFSKQEQSLRDMRKVGSKLKQAFIKRTEQADQLQQYISQSPYPVIVCGDFNDTPVSYAYQKIRGTLKDAFVESGHGISNTYRGNLPSFRIDYILHSAYFSSYNFKVDNVLFSDHYPVNCTLIPKDTRLNK